MCCLRTSEGIHDRASLWNAIESLDGLHGQYCRSWDIALPHELSLDQQRALVLGFIDHEFTSRGMIADWAIHDKDESKKDSPTDQNIHVHIMTTMRPIVQDRSGKWQFGKKWKSVTERDEDGNAICIGRDKRGHKGTRNTTSLRRIGARKQRFSPSVRAGLTPRTRLCSVQDPTLG